MIVFNSDGTKITNDSVSITHTRNQQYTLFLRNEINKKVIFWTHNSKFTSSTLDNEQNTKEISELTINGNQYSLSQPE